MAGVGEGGLVHERLKSQVQESEVSQTNVKVGPVNGPVPVKLVSSGEESEIQMVDKTLGVWSVAECVAFAGSKMSARSDRKGSAACLTQCGCILVWTHMGIWCGDQPRRVLSYGCVGAMLALGDTRARFNFSCGSGKVSGTGKQARKDACYRNDDGMNKVSQNAEKRKELCVEV